MPYPTMMEPPNSSRVVYEAKLPWLMPGAHALTRELTAAIVESDGLLDAPPAPVVLSTAAVRQKTAATRAQAAALRREVAQLCTQAVALHREAAQLCKLPP
jgi:hypothetical protein